jgi:hypothetical protein
MKPLHKRAIAIVAVGTLCLTMTAGTNSRTRHSWSWYHHRRTTTTTRATTTTQATTTTTAATTTTTKAAPPTGGPWWTPSSAAPISWYWQLQGAVSTSSLKASVYDIDGFDNSATTVAALHAKSAKVICYIDLGTYEPGRPDLNLIPSADIGNGVQGWPGERWLNIADISGLTPLVQSRMQMCKSKGFDAIEPDDIDGYTNGTGFSSVTASAQAAYNKFLADTAHSLGMSIGLKNDVDQLSQLQPYFDWALNEECNQYSECGGYSVFTNANKAVFNAEYGSSNTFCSADAQKRINGARFDLDLTGQYTPCTNNW